MVKVLIIGATGYLGLALSQSLLRSGGYKVWGIARTSEKARQLALEEITPVECPDPVNSPEAYLSVIRDERIDIVVDVAGTYQDSAKILSDLVRAGKERLASYERNRTRGPKLGFVYCSGAWVHGSTLEPVSDLTPVGTDDAPAPPSKIVAFRPAIEQAVLAAGSSHSGSQSPGSSPAAFEGVLDTIVVRPALVYGRSSWSLVPLFGPILEAAVAGGGKTKMGTENNTIQVPLDKDAVSGLLHVDDTASGLHAAVEKLPLIAGTGVYPVFDLLTSTEKMTTIVEAAAREFGYKGKIEYTGPGGHPFLEALSSKMVLDASRAKQLLGWEPKRIGFLPHADVYARAFAAAQSAARSSS
ncbi:NAD(P)-binding protein [Xylona heveae TC161]|uniref:NAD(P)-binding protein n=1 Tax=Xylona heveae (strain CBS 132557 / TC161) TaxID=1328760 RepID=A0A165J9G4_XYLHT|nr:NAD(P)-binding protein [Xylona heveae TC161]KZF25931.1 NAD(P)-binding protein [Xylona heveae TC161]